MESWPLNAALDTRCCVFGQGETSTTSIDTSTLYPVGQAQTWFQSRVVSEWTPDTIVFARRSERVHWLRTSERVLVLSQCGTPVGIGDTVRCHMTVRRDAPYDRLLLFRPNKKK